MKKEEIIISGFVFLILIYFLFFNTFLFAIEDNGNVSFDYLGPELLIDIVVPLSHEFWNYTNRLTELNVTSNFDVETWTMDLFRYPDEVVIYEDVVFLPNYSFLSARGYNYLFVSATNSYSGYATDDVLFFVNSSNHAPVLRNVANLYGCENEYLDYYFYASDSDWEILSADMNPLDPFFLFTNPINYTDLSIELFSGILDKEDTLTIHEQEITVTDGELVDSFNFNVTVIPVNNPPFVQEIGVQTVYLSPGSNSFTYGLELYDVEEGNRTDSNFSYSLEFYNSTAIFDIDGYGFMNYTARVEDIGVYNISLCVGDSGTETHPNISLCEGTSLSLQTCINFSFTVTDDNRPPEIVSYFPEELNFSGFGTDYFYFNISTFDPDETIPDIYWYLNDSLIEYVFGNQSDDINITFGCSVFGNYTIKAEITDGLANDSIQWNLSVKSNPCSLPPSGGGGGGGGGGQISPFCLEKWGCLHWGSCNSISFFDKTGLNPHPFGLLNRSNSNLLEENRAQISNISMIEQLYLDCFVQGISRGDCGYQIRSCLDVNECKTYKYVPETLRACGYTKQEASCSDNIKNCHHGSCEVLADCGGPCSPCPTCRDGIKNQNEEGVDCGGPCEPCIFNIPYTKVLGRVSIFIILLDILLILLVIYIIYRIYKAYKEYKEKSRERLNLKN